MLVYFCDLFSGRIMYLSDMKQKWLWLPLCFILPAAFALLGKEKNRGVKAPETGFAVVELFTSEGCSSCPAADQLVEKIGEENKGKRVYIASYHVDYWDRLGWKDRFSKPGYSAYQYAYAKQFHLNSVYTPQIVLNGQSQFVGSNGILLRSSISNKLNSRESAHLELSKLDGGPSVCKVHYLLQEASPSAVLTFVLLQEKAVVNIERGENSGKTLTHTNIVHEVKALPPGNTSGDFSISIPEGIRNQWELLCYVKSSTGEILTAQRIGSEP